jgi:multidrug efflux system outer membrane protein
MRKFALLLVTALAGCSLVPDLEKPALPTAQNWPGAEAPGSQVAADIGWRSFFADPVTQALIAEALASNRDLRIAALTAEAAEAQYRSSHASLFPELDATAGFERSRTPGDVYGSSSSQNLRQYSAGLGVVSWELDFFGKLRSASQQARETWLQDKDLRESEQIAIVAQVASAYDTWLADSAAHDIARETAEVEARTLQLTQAKLDHGSATGIDVAQAEASLRSAQASLAQYARTVAQDMDSLVLLVGAPISESTAKQMQDAAARRTLPPVPELAPGLPSDLLTRRPDIRAAEHALSGANANIGAARAAFFPSVTLTANGGTAGEGMSRLFGAGQGAWLFEPQLSVPIFDEGRNQAALDLAKTQTRIEVATYEKTIQSAFRDVADALAARRTYADQLAAQQALVAADQRYYKLAQMRFSAGADNFLNVLVSQDSLLSARLNQVSLQLAAAQNGVTLYKALGGGWTEADAHP